MKIVIIIIGIALIVFGFTQWKKSKQLEYEIGQVATNFDLSKQKFVEKRAADSSLLITQQELIVSKNSELAKLIEEKKGLENIKQQIKVETVFEIPPGVVAKLDSLQTLVIQQNDSTQVTYLQLPFSFGEQDEWYSYGFTIEPEDVYRDSLSFKNTFDITYGFKTRSFLEKIKFQKPEPEVLFNSLNPYSKVTKFSNITIRDKVKRSGIGIHIGYDPFINKGAVISVGYNYNLIMF